ncbi:aquaporin [Actinoplanes sp. NPDC026619]|uniref:MIP/aquaporin family protein n=1 Tax=Actinoplanes sp. NPDC026619 TaxID=3155798 RepID=UPI0033D5A6AE
MKIDWRPTRGDMRAALVEFVLTTLFFAAVFGLVRWGIGAMAAGGSAAELRVRVVVVSMVVGLVIVGFATSRAGRFSGAHMNPAITLGLYAFGSFPGRRVVPYLVAQSAGSVAAAGITWLAWGRAATTSVVQPAAGWGGAAVFVAEAATLAVIVATMCWLTANRPAWRWPGPWIVGGLFGVQGAVLGTFTGGSANPMRQLGPALFAGQFHLLAVYLLAPIVGAMIAGWVSWRLQVRSLPALAAEPVAAHR